jgi:hypothetical protein
VSHVDLDAILDGEQGLPFTFTFGGEEFTLPPQIDMRALMLMNREDIDGAMSALMGEDQYVRFLKANGRLTQARFEALMKAYARHQGVDDMGESSGSSSSLPATETPSRLTLPGITGSTSGQPSQRAS